MSQPFQYAMLLEASEGTIYRLSHPGYREDTIQVRWSHGRATVLALRQNGWAFIATMPADLRDTAEVVRAIAPVLGFEL